jgi:carbon-monoxide dehydrogenase medium subunit
VKPPPFRYYDPTTLQEALELLATKDNAKLLAGGQSLMAMLNLRVVQPDHLIDLNRIPELAFLDDDGEGLRIGSMARQRELELSPLVQKRCPLMHEALRNVGHRQTRNRGTIGGSLCHLDPTAELPSVAMAYDAVIEVGGGSGSRTVPMLDFPVFYMTPAIEPHEVVTAVRLAHWPKGHGSAFLEFARRHGDFAVVSVAVLLDVGRDGRVRRTSLTVSGVGPRPVRVTAAERLLTGAKAEAPVFSSAAEACRDIDATGDVHASADYRRHLAATLAYRALQVARTRARPVEA